MSHPRGVEVMHRHRPFLGVYARSEHGGRTEYDTYFSLVHRVDDGLASLFVLALLNEAVISKF